ncbi:hypothetical protein PG996_015489 [Apiospora saccharicola]|uniref:Uncharacterized protein n=1 Tax=Apiospora saccharicola TaxID=335842 RepID=A0ABR1TL87_9PEZI
MSPAGPFHRAHGTKYWTCQYDKCRQECDASHDYCQYHGCEWPIRNAPAGTSSRCNAQRSGDPVGGLFTLCSHHRCKDPTCGAPAAITMKSEYCRVHTCHATPICHERVARNPTTNRFTSYCGNHKCSHEDCADLRATTPDPDPKDASRYQSDGSSMGHGYRPFCQKHSCLVDGCLNIAVEEGLGAGLGYCQFHVALWENSELGD